MKENILLDKSLDFAADIVLLYEEYSKARKDPVPRPLMDLTQETII